VRLLDEIPDDPSKPQSWRFQKISDAMGGVRTMRQVQRARNDADGMGRGADVSVMSAGGHPCAKVLYPAGQGQPTRARPLSLQL
jgi:hypothetical protein